MSDLMFDPDDSESPPPETPTEPTPTNLDDFDAFIEGSENKVQQKPWMKTKTFTLGTVGNLASIIDACIASKRYSLDLECSGLDNRTALMPDGYYRTIDHIAGICISPDGNTGYYIPLHHAKQIDGERKPLDCNIPTLIFDKEFRRLIEATDAGKTVAIFHNGKFDQEFLQFNETGKPWGEWDKPSFWHDTMILTYLRNPRARVKGLKKLSAAMVPAEWDKLSLEAKQRVPTGGPGLAMEMIELHELWGHEHSQAGFRYDFTTLDPNDPAVLWYACSDAICTWLLFDVLKPSVFENDTDGQNMTAIYSVEKLCVAATRWMERNRIHIDKEKVWDLIVLGQQEWYDSVKEVYQAASEILKRDIMPPFYKTMLEAFVPNDRYNLLRQQYQMAESLNKDFKPTKIEGTDYQITYDVEAPAQIGWMFKEMGVQGLLETENSGQIKTNKEEINKIIEREGTRFPFMHKIGKFRAVNTALSGFLYPMFQNIDKNGLGRISFQGHKIDTGRFATPTSDNESMDSTKSHMTGWLALNLQAIPNTGDTNRPACMLRLRECVTARPNGEIPKFFLSIDLSGEELRIITNMSLEPKWLAEFFHCSGCNRTFEAIPRPPMANGGVTATPLPPPARCPNCGSDKIGDLHTLTGIAVFGADAPNQPDWKALRGKAKALNFAMAYGGGGSAAQRAVGVDKNEGGRIKLAFDGAYITLKRWWDSQHKFARKHKFVRTAFKRKYPVPDIDSQDGKFRSGAERNAINGPIQGSGADFIKIAMALIYKEMKKRGWLEKVMMTITMHDELCFEIDADILEIAIPVLSELVNSNDMILGLNWRVPLTSDIELGNAFNVPWNLNEMRYGEVRFIGNKKYKGKKDLPPGVDWETLSHWPDALKRWFSEARNEPAPKAPAPPTAPVDATSPVPVIVSVPEPVSIATKANVQSQVPVSQVSVNPDNPNEFVHRLRAPMNFHTAVRLADLIVDCSHQADMTLKLRSLDDQPIDGWIQEAGLAKAKINHVKFQVLSAERKL